MRIRVERVSAPRTGHSGHGGHGGGFLFSALAVRTAAAAPDRTALARHRVLRNSWAVVSPLRRGTSTAGSSGAPRRGRSGGGWVRKGMAGRRAPAAGVRTRANSRPRGRVGPNGNQLLGRDSFRISRRASFGESIAPRKHFWCRSNRTDFFTNTRSPSSPSTLVPSSTRTTTSPAANRFPHPAHRSSGFCFAILVRPYQRRVGSGTPGQIGCLNPRGPAARPAVRVVDKSWDCPCRGSPADISRVLDFVARASGTRDRHGSIRQPAS